MSFLVPKQNLTTRAEKINTFQATRCEYGTLPTVYGTAKVSPNLINYLDFYAQERKTTTKTGKHSSSTQVDYAYYVYVEMALCSQSIEGVEGIDVGGSFYNSLAQLNSNGNNAGSGLSLNLGDNPNPTAYMESKHPDIAVGYQDMAYLYGRIYLGLNNASMPSYSVIVKGRLRDTGDGVDANPADVIVDMLHEVGISDDYIDASSLDNFRRYCKEADLLISSPMGYFDQQKSCQSVVADLLKLTNTYMFWSVDKFKFVVRDDRRQGRWMPNKQIIYALTEDDLISSNGVTISFSRKDSSEQYNRFGVSFTNRANSFESEQVYFENSENILVRGVKTAPTFDALWIHTKSRAVKVAEMQARINNTENVRYTFKLPMTFSRLECGDLVTLQDSSIGLTRQPVMIESISEDRHGYLTVTALKRADGAYTAPLLNVNDYGYNNINFNIEPFDTASPIFVRPPKEMITSATGLELWIALHGERDTWGGCGVYASDKDGDYKQIGMHPRSSVFGYTLTAMDAESDTVDVKATNPQLIEFDTGSEFDAENNNTLIWIDGEFISYANAELIDDNTYRLSGLLRGRFDTEAVEHPAISNTALCDSNLYVVEIPRMYEDRTIYFKFPAFNYLGTNWQTLEDLPYYTAEAVGTATNLKDVKTLDTELLANGVRRFWWEWEGDTRSIAGFEIRYMQGAYPNWEKGIPLHTGYLTSQPFETDALRQGTHTVMIKAVDIDGAESPSPCYAILNLGDLLEDNVLYREHFNRDDWSHVIHDGLVRDEGLVTKDSQAFWTTQGDAFWTNPEDNFWEGAYSELNMLYQSQVMASGQMWLDYDIEGSFRLEYRIVGENAFWSYPSDNFWKGEADSEFWKDETVLWKPYTCKVEVYAGQSIQIRAYTGASNQPTRINDIVLIIDVPDREEHFENVEVGVDGVLLPIKTPNYYTTSVRIDAVQGHEVINRAVVIEKNPCLIRLLDMNNQPMSAVVDVTWQGFRKEIL